MTSIDSSLSINGDGWCSSLPRPSCPNFDARPADTPISLLVIHNISLPPGEFGGNWIEALFSNTLDCDAHPYFDQLRGVKVSAHFLVRRDGRILQFVSANDRAWHVVGHQHIAPDRKTDPGPYFDWQRFQREFSAETLGQFGRAPSQCVLRFPD